MAQRKAKGRDAILDAAEDLFSRLGYHGVSLRDISGMAGVELGLVSYHFKTKDELFRLVVERRAEAMRTLELASLSAAEEAGQGSPVPVEDVLAAYVGSRFEMLFAMGDQWARYVRLSHHFLALEDRGRLIGAFRQESQAIRSAYVSALCRGLPGADPEQVGTAFDLLRLAVSGIAADTENLIVRSSAEADRQDALAQIVSIHAAGLRALVSA